MGAARSRAAGSGSAAEEVATHSSAAGSAYAYAATEEELKSLTPKQLDLRSRLEAQINRYPVKEGYSRCFHSTDMDAAFKIVATGLRPSELYNSQLGGRRNHNAGAFVTKLSPLVFGFPVHGWLGRLLNNNYGKHVERDPAKNEWVTKRGEVCLVLDLPNTMLKDAAEEDPTYKDEGRNVFYVPKDAFDMFDQQQLPPKLIVFAFRTTLDRKPTAKEADFLEPRLAEALERDFFEAQWLLHLALEEEAAAERRLETLWSERCKRAVERLQPYCSEKAVQKIQQVLLSHSTELVMVGGLQRGDERMAVTVLIEVLRPHSSLLKLQLSNVSVTGPGAAALAEALVQNRSLWTLDLGGNSVGDEGASKLGEALQCNGALRCLDLMGNKIGKKGAAALGHALQRNSTLQELYLRGNSIGDQGAAALSEALQRNSTVQKLSLDSNNIGTQGASALAEALQRNSMLQELYLRFNTIGDEGVTAIGWALQPHGPLQLLDLGFNPIGAGGAAALGEALARNNTLLELCLSGNCIGDRGAAALGEALQRNCTLQALDLRSNSIGGFGAAALSEALQRNGTLRKLDLRWNDISNERKATLRALQHNSPLRDLGL